MQYGKKVSLKDFVLDKGGLITYADMDLKNYLFERGNPNMNRDSNRLFTIL